MAKLIILRGNSGSGKTTIAKGLQKKFGHGTMLNISTCNVWKTKLWNCYYGRYIQFKMV